MNGPGFRTQVAVHGLDVGVVASRAVDSWVAVRVHEHHGVVPSDYSKDDEQQGTCSPDTQPCRTEFVQKQCSGCAACSSSAQQETEHNKHEVCTRATAVGCSPATQPRYMMHLPHVCDMLLLAG